MGRGLVVRRRVDQVAPRRRVIRQFLHVDRTKIRRMSIHSMHIETLAAVQRLVRPRWFRGSRVLEDSRRCCRSGRRGGGGVDRVVNDGDVAPHSVVLRL